VPECFYPLLATWALTGMREREATGLLVEDVNFMRRKIAIRANEFRGVRSGIKNNESVRTIPLVPQLEGILREYLDRYGHRLNRLLFPSERLRQRQGVEGMIVDSRKPLDRVAARVGFRPGDIRTKIFRHSFCAAALQTLDHGAPIARYTVESWMGHGSGEMVSNVYSHLGEVRIRKPHVEFVLEDVPADQLARLRHLRIA
jgi:integrase